MSHDSHPQRARRRRLRILLAEDEPQMRTLVADALRRDGHFVLEAPDGAALLEHLQHALQNDFPEAADSLIISDVRMPRRGGLGLIQELLELQWCPPCILITGFGDEQLHAEARRLGAVAVFDKPFDVDDLRATVNRLASDAGGYLGQSSSALAWR
jgi:two-component system, response regulator, stage 0 sporulation protein F